MFVYDTDNINRIILELLPAKKGLQELVYKAMHEAVSNGGKRIRPILMLETYRLFTKGDEIDIKYFMTAMEMIHAFSLVHDDLPCMDNDTMRRGKPTTWVVYGEDMAVLTGDALLIEAFDILLKRIPKALNIDRFIRAMQILSHKTGMQGMIGGQVVDVQNTSKSLNKEELDFIYRLKTGALLEASMMIGAIIGGADDKDVEKIEKIASYVGLAFQIKDDILDETSTGEELGKPVHSDEKNNKTTYVTLYGIDEAEGKLKALSDEAKALLHTIKGDSGVLESILNFLVSRNK